MRLVRDLGVDIYRFSIPWTRILPNGHINNINKAGIEHYNNLINGKEFLHYLVEFYLNYYF